MNKTIHKFYLCRFVSFLLRLAHDKSLQRTGASTILGPVELLLMKQVNQLAAQISKTNATNSESDGHQGSGMAVSAATPKAMASLRTTNMRILGTVPATVDLQARVL